MQLLPAARTQGSRWRPDTFGFVAVALAVFVTLLVLYPILATWIGAFFDAGRPTLSPVVEAAGQPRLGRVLWNTAVTITVSAVLALLVASTFAWLNERSDARMGWVTGFLPIMPLLVPPIAGAIGWTILLSPRAGYLNVVIRAVASWFGIDMAEGPLDVFNWYGLIFVYTLYLVPHAYLPVAAALRNLDPSLEEAARSSGSTPWRTLRDVTLPSIKPAIAAGGLLAVVYGFALFSIPVIIGQGGGIEVLSVRIVRLMRFFPPQVDAAIGLGFIMVAVIATGWWLQWRIIRSRRFAAIGGRGMRATRVSLGAWKWPSRAVLLTYLLVTSVLPLAGLVIVSTQGFWSASIDWSAATFDNYRRVLVGIGFAARALRNSVLLGAAGATVSVLVTAILVTWTQQRAQTPFARLVDGATKLPGAVSNIIIGIAFIAALAGPPWGLHGTLTMLFLAYIVLTLPQASFNASAAYAQVGGELGEASAVSGATRGRTFARINLPLMVPGLAAGWAMVFVLMAGDITASAMLAGPRNPVVGFVVLDLWNHGTYPLLAALATSLSLLCTVVVFTVLKITQGRWFSFRN